MQYMEMRRKIIEMQRFAYDRGFTDTTGLIITVRVGEDRFLTTASGISFRRFTDREEDLVLLDGNLSKIEGLRPVPASTQINIACIKAFPHINAAVHVHSHTSGAFAALGMSPEPITPAAKRIGHVPVLKDEELDVWNQNGGDLGLVPLKDNDKTLFAGTPELVRIRHRFSSTVVRHMSQYESEMESHGVGFLVDFDYGLFVLGRHFDEPFDTIERIENNAKLLLNMNILQQQPSKLIHS